MFRVATAVQKITTDLNGLVSEEEKIVARRKIFIILTNVKGHYISQVPKFVTFHARSQALSSVNI
jgi:hypothetical protein